MVREGNDGLWSTFSIGIGSPAQYVRVLISTTIIQPWAVLSEGCVAFSSPDCVDSRGGVFETNTSTTWDSLGFYDLVFERNLGYEGNGKFGYDTVTLGLPGTGLPALDHQVVVGVETPDFYIAPWGIRPAPTNLTTVDNPITSLLSTLRNQNLVPSLSWGYTAGAYHQWQGISGLPQSAPFSTDQLNSKPAGPGKSHLWRIRLSTLRTEQSYIPIRC